MKMYKEFLHVIILYFLVLSVLTVVYDGNHFMIYICFLMYFIFRLYINERST